MKVALAFLLSVPGALAQAPDRTSEPAGLPRFTLRQIITGRNDSLVRIPGRWFRAATLTFAESLITRSYQNAARRSGVEPLAGEALSAERSCHVMGLYRRAELVDATRRTLDSIRDAIPSDTTRARFDHLFRPRDEWVVDLHDAALAWTRLRIPGFAWRATRPALLAVHRIPTGGPETDENTLRAMYGLAVLAATDSASFARVRSDLGRVDSASATAVLAGLSGYTEALKWYTAVLQFFLDEPWMPQGRSLRDLVRDAWARTPGRDFDPGLPVIQPQWFGYPQAVPQYGIPPALFSRLVVAQNPGASKWLEKHGQPALLRSLRLLPVGDTNLTLLHAGSETLRLTSVSRQARESLNGYLEPRDVVAIDPGYSPILAIGTVIHEWQHLLFRRRQLEIFAGALPARTPVMVALPGLQPHLAEGFAEWSAEQILEQVMARWPLLGLGELEKRADLVRRGSEDQHAIGYALVTALAAALPDPDQTTEFLLRNAQDPSRIPSEPALRAAWSRYRGAAGKTLRTSMYPTLTPEVTFTMDGSFPDVVTTRILVPSGNDPR